MSETIVLSQEEALQVAYKLSNSITQHAAMLAHHLADSGAETDSDEVATLVALDELLSDMAHKRGRH